MKIALYSIGFGRPDLLTHQVRLLRRYLEDDFDYTMIDNTPGAQSYEMQRVAHGLGVDYLYSPSERNLHHEALDFAALHVTRCNHDFFGFLDHDVFPRRDTSLLEKLLDAGFYGVGQTHAPTGRQYLWPGFCFFSKAWLGDRKLNFNGIRGVSRRDDGDTGSMNWPLFTGEDWSKLWSMEHGYKAIREPDGEGLQSWGIELLGDWVHFTNASHWKEVSDSGGRDKLLVSILEEM